MSQTPGAQTTVERCFLFEGTLLTPQEASAKAKRNAAAAQWIKEAQPGQTHQGFRCLAGSVEQRRSDAEFIQQIVTALLVHEQDVGLKDGTHVLRHLKRYEHFEGEFGTEEVTSPGIYLLTSVEKRPSVETGRRRAAARPPVTRAPFWRFVCGVDDADHALAPLISDISAFDRMNILTTLQAERAIESPSARGRSRAAGMHRACSRACAATPASTRVTLRNGRQPVRITRGV